MYATHTRKRVKCHFPAKTFSNIRAWGLALASSKKLNLSKIISLGWLGTRALQPWRLRALQCPKAGGTYTIKLRRTIVDVRASVCGSIIALQINIPYNETYLTMICAYICMNACIVK